MFVPLSWLTATTIAIIHPITNQVEKLDLAESMDEAIRDYDPFYAPNEKDEYCGGNRTLASVPGIIRDMGFRADLDGDDGRIFDDVVMDYWESHDDDRYWTPLCVARFDLVRVGK